MNRSSRLIASIFVAIVPIACSSGGGGGGSAAATPASFAGSWDVTFVAAPTTCDPNPQYTETIPLTITVNESTATISGGPFDITLPIVNGRIQGYFPFNLSTYDWGLTDANRFTGTQVSGTLGECDAIFNVTGVRTAAPLPDPTPSAQQWNGTWDFVGTQSSTTCVPDPQFGTQTATISITISGSTATLDLGAFSIELPIVNDRIQGYSSFNLTTYDLQLTGANSFTGTQTSSIPTGGGCEVVFAIAGTRVGS